MPGGSAILLTALIGLDAGKAGPAGLVDELQCIDHIEYGREPDRHPWLLWGTLRWHRLENVIVYPDRHLRLFVQLQAGGMMVCTGTLTAERMEAFQLEIARTRIWRVRGRNHSPGEHEYL